MTIDLSNGCKTPYNLQVKARIKPYGLYELAVFKLDRDWHWVVLLMDQERGHGVAGSRGDALRAAEWAARHMSDPDPGASR